MCVAGADDHPRKMIILLFLKEEVSARLDYLEVLSVLRPSRAWIWSLAFASCSAQEKFRSSLEAWLEVNLAPRSLAVSSLMVK